MHVLSEKEILSYLNKELKIHNVHLTSSLLLKQKLEESSDIRHKLQVLGISNPSFLLLEIDSNIYLVWMSGLHSMEEVLECRPMRFYIEQTLKMEKNAKGNYTFLPMENTEAEAIIYLSEQTLQPI